MNSFIDTFVIIGTLISIVLGLTLYFFNIDASASLLFGLMGIIITLILDLFKRISELSDLLGRKFKFLERLVRQPRWLYRSIENVTESFETINNEIAKPLFRDAAEEALYSFRDKMDELGRGILKVSSSEKQVLLHAVRNAQSEVLATSLVHADIESWHTPSGERYLNENVLAIKRGVHVERVFIYDDLSEKLLLLCQVLQDSECKVWLIDINKIPLEKRIDMVIFDKAMVYEAFPDYTGGVGEYQFSVKDSTIKNRLSNFHFILGLAESLESIKLRNGDKHDTIRGLT